MCFESISVIVDFVCCVKILLFVVFFRFVISLCPMSFTLGSMLWSTSLRGRRSHCPLTSSSISGTYMHIHVHIPIPNFS